MTWYIENNLLIICQLFNNNLPIQISCYIAHYLHNHLPIIFTNPNFFLYCQSFVSYLPIFYQMDYQWFTNVIFVLLTLPIVYQSFPNQLHPFYYIDHIAAVATNYSNLMCQCFTNHYQSDPVLYITRLSMITNKLPTHHYHS